MMQSDASTLMMYDVKKKSMLLAYVLWLFLGTFGAHRFYLGKIGTAVTMLVIALVSYALVFVFIGFFGLFALSIWWIVDAFLIYSIVNQHNINLAAKLS